VKAVSVAALILVSLVAVCPEAGGAPPVYRVDHVVDGDTIALRNGQRVRLVQIDTPDVFFGVECYGRAASRQTKRLLRPGSRVRLFAEPATDRVDSLRPQPRRGRSPAATTCSDAAGRTRARTAGGRTRARGRRRPTDGGSSPFRRSPELRSSRPQAREPNAVLGHVPTRTQCCDLAGAVASVFHRPPARPTQSSPCGGRTARR
jgi:hypothetical protein